MIKGIYDPKCIPQVEFRKLSEAEMLQLLGDFFHQIPYRGSAPGPHWGTPSLTANPD